MSACAGCSRKKAIDLESIAQANLLLSDHAKPSRRPFADVDLTRQPLWLPETGGAGRRDSLATAIRVAEQDGELDEDEAEARELARGEVPPLVTIRALETWRSTEQQAAEQSIWEAKLRAEELERACDRVAKMPYPDVKEELLNRGLDHVGSFKELTARLLADTIATHESEGGKVEMTEVPPLVYLCLQRLASLPTEGRGEGYEPRTALTMCRAVDLWPAFNWCVSKGKTCTKAMKQGMYANLHGMLSDQLDFTSTGLRGALAPVVVKLAYTAKPPTVKLSWLPGLDHTSVSALLKNRSFLRELTLSFNRIGPSELRLFSEALSESPSLRLLDLSGNKLGTKGSGILAEALAKNDVLTDLNIAFNNIGIQGAVSLSPSLRGHPSLESINLRGNGVGLQGATALAHAMAKMPQLRAICIADNQIDRKGAAIIATSVKVPLKSLLRAFGVAN